MNTMIKHMLYAAVIIPQVIFCAYLSLENITDQSPTKKITFHDDTTTYCIFDIQKITGTLLKKDASLSSCSISPRIIHKLEDFQITAIKKNIPLEILLKIFKISPYKIYPTKFCTITIQPSHETIFIPSTANPYLAQHDGYSSCMSLQKKKEAYAINFFDHAHNIKMNWLDKCQETGHMFDGPILDRYFVAALRNTNNSTIYLLKRTEFFTAEAVAKITLPNIHELACDPHKNSFICCHTSNEYVHQKLKKVYFSEYNFSDSSQQLYRPITKRFVSLAPIPFCYTAPLETCHIGLHSNGIIRLLYPAGTTFDTQEKQTTYMSAGQKITDLFVHMAVVHYSDKKPRDSFVVVNQDGMIFYYSFDRRCTINKKNTLLYIDTLETHDTARTSPPDMYAYTKACKLWATDDTLSIQHPDKTVEYKKIILPARIIRQLNCTPTPNQLDLIDR